MARGDSCLARVGAGVAIGGAVGGAVGAVYGTYEAIRYKVPGLLKIRYIGQTTLGSAAVFGLFLGAGRPVWGSSASQNLELP
uniref:Reactive oxygen species modulator 1 n=1 Tax=Leersia perrieri TaxID=77586 RepID=A0A0D9XKY2_9ORYZ